MPVLIRIPPAGDHVKTVKVVRWLEEEGDAVEASAPLLEVETDKANADIFAERSGWLAAQLAPAGSIVDVGAVVASLALTGEDVSAVRSAALANDRPALRLVPPPRRTLFARLLGLRS